mmetsp:Transcript_79822/g.158631  ORF Transcript_79822/g.158631 Transcript_79822/m.158631 type:complete len:257 (-) Transcript_79822:28-798(-)
MGLHLLAALRARHLAWPQLGGRLARPLPRQCHSSAYTREAMVRSALRTHWPRRHPSVRLYLHRDVFCLHLVLELQVLLRLRLHVSRLRDPRHRHHLRYHRRHLLSAQQRGLSLAVDLLRLIRLDSRLRAALLGLLLLHKDENVWLLPDHFLLYVHAALLPRPWCHVRHPRLHGVRDLRAAHLSQHQVGLSGNRARSATQDRPRDRPEIGPAHQWGSRSRGSAKLTLEHTLALAYTRQHACTRCTHARTRTRTRVRP